MPSEPIPSRIWNEIPEEDDPFAASTCFCWGYDVFGDLLRHATWVEYLYLLFAGERPGPEQARLLESLALVLANPGIRDHSVRAAMNGGVGGSTNASSLIAALAVGAGQFGGAREIYRAVGNWESCGHDLSRWQALLESDPCSDGADVWPEMEHPAGFDPHAKKCARPVLQALEHLSSILGGGTLSWLTANRVALEEIAGVPLALSGVCAAGFHDLGLTADQSEMLYLILRLPGAAVHALERKQYGWRKYPFFANQLQYPNKTSGPEAG